MEAFRRLLQMDGCFTVDCMGLSGGIALLWRDEWHGVYNVLPAISSDHSPLSVSLHNTSNGRKKRRWCFRYEMAWEVKEECLKVVGEAWQNAGITDCQAKSLRTQLDLCQKGLMTWRQTLKQQKDQIVKNGILNIGHLQNYGTGEHVAAMKQFQEEVVNAITANDMKWKQRAEQHWLKHGDRNTQYFHMQASQRKKINAVNSIVDSQGRVVTDQSEIGEVFTVFFSSLFTTSQPLSIDQCLQEMDTKLDMDMKAWLLKPFTREEITAAFFKMNPLGSPGPDGFPAQFYQKNLEVVGIKSVILLFNSSIMVDLSVRVEWDFIEAIMTKMDFPGHWIHITKACLSSVSYSVLVNGEPQEKFAPSRGLRQGNPLSPYLFILCAEGLSSLLKHAEACGNLTPVTIGRGPIKVSHLFFADDSLLFCQTKYEEINCVLKILELYEKGSGQVINKDKSAIFFSKNTTLMTQQQIKSLAGVQSTSNFEKYLGLPSLVGRKKIASFHSLIDRTWSRVSNWRTKFLSAAGKEILLKAVLQAIPTYAMGMFLLPASITRRLNQILRRWIPSLPGQQIVTPRDDDCWCDKVSDIIDPQLKIWQESLLDELFSIQEREGIKAIPISLGGREDKLIWQFTPNGIYTVKSGYYLGKELEREKIGESSGKTMDCLVWRSIWKLKVPPATRMFVWRACSEVLPTMANLKRRKVIKDSSCLICKKEHETSGHALWGCSGAQDVWSQELIGKLDSEELNEAAITLRLIWARRNDVLHGKAFKHPREIIAQPRTELTLHNETMQKMVDDNSENMTRVLEWTKPAAGCLKVNWDVAVQMRMGRIGIGVIIRDHHGLVIGALRANRPLKGSVFDAEAYGLLLACVFCKEIGVRQICLEGDSKQVMDQMNQDSPNWSLGGCLISDAKEILNLAAVWSISHAYREANMAAHMLAQAAYECTEDMYDIEICPACICQVVSKEMRH
ncbi:uncharacterized protein LOC118348908 [Juglans regia]|uniref:Uncharacterized protein LOC118348908 n=1 Tax=Juglans regia TaxID=51240 RepID=A0A6P9EXT8_JUGRE|nr:uncharacterized protein LOC118348908 [Juglans regia]